MSHKIQGLVPGWVGEGLRRVAVDVVKFNTLDFVVVVVWLQEWLDG